MLLSIQEEPRCIPRSQQTLMEGCFVFLCAAAIPIGLMVTGRLMHVCPLQIIVCSYALSCLLPDLGLYTSRSVKKMFQENIPVGYYTQQYSQFFDRL